MPVLMRLRLKYRTRGGSFKCGIYRPRTGNSHAHKARIEVGLRPRRRAYWPWRL
jgi:hypothetical protein